MCYIKLQEEWNKTLLVMAFLAFSLSFSNFLFKLAGAFWESDEDSIVTAIL